MHTPCTHRTHWAHTVWPQSCSPSISTPHMHQCFIHLYAPTRTYMHLHAPTCTYTHLHAPTCTYTHLHAPTRTYTHLHAPTCTYMHLHAPTRTYMHLHAPTCTYTHLHAIECCTIALCSKITAAAQTGVDISPMPRARPFESWYENFNMLERAPVPHSDHFSGFS